MKKFIFLNILLLSCFFCFATNVPAGYVSGTWDTYGSPYYIQGNIIVDNNTSLTITDPSVQVVFQGQYTLTVNGGLNAYGATFTYTTSTPGWGGIIINNTGGGYIPTLENCTIEYVTGAPAITITNINNGVYFRITSCTIQHNSNINGQGSAAGIHCINSEGIITQSTITDNIINAGATGAGIYCYNCNSSLEISDNDINNNTNTSWNSSGGIFCNHSSPDIIHNTITENNGEAGAGINCSNYSSPHIYGENTISYNNSITRGGGIIIKGYSNPIIENNIITYNTAHLGGGGINIVQCCSPEILYNNISWNDVNDNNSHTNSDRGGGGICINESSSYSWPIIEHNEISNNHVHVLSGCNNTSAAGNGGGIYINSALTNATIRNNTIQENTAENNGAGIYICDAHETVIEYNTILNNNVNVIYNWWGGNLIKAGNGGGIYITDPLTDPILYPYGYAISINTIKFNTIQDNHADNNGGGMYIGNVYRADIKLNKIIHNECRCIDANPGYGIFTNFGGGICVIDQEVNNIEIINNLIVKNEAGILDLGNFSFGHGGGIYHYVLGLLGTYLIVNNNTIADNWAATDAGGIYAGGGNYANNILWGNTILGNNQMNSANMGLSFNNNFPLFQYCDIEDYGGVNYTSPNFVTNDDPQFIDPSNNDYRVHYGTSPCVDRGDSTIQPHEQTDIRYYSRTIFITAPEIDMGAYEHDANYDIFIFIPVELTALDEQTNTYQGLSSICYPNPMSTTTNIEFSLNSKCKTRIEIFNALGQPIELLADKYLDSGKHSLIWNIGNNPKGLYFCRLTINNKNIIQKLIVE
jgi:parallel beta-helix repeat protein